MDNETRSWLVAVPFNPEGTRTPHTRPALSYGQKRELASFTGLVMASTVFFLTPLLPSSPAPSPDAVPQLAQSVTDIVPTAPAPIPAPVVTSVRVTRRATLTKPTVALVPERTLAMTTTLNKGVIGAPKESGRGRRRGVASGLVRALVGTGRYRVQPFPMPASGD